MSTATPTRIVLSEDLEHNIRAIDNMLKRSALHQVARDYALAVLEKFRDELVPTYKMKLCVAISAGLSPIPHDDLELKKLVHDLWDEALRGISNSSYDDVVMEGCRMAEIYLAKKDFERAGYTLRLIHPYAISGEATMRHDFVWTKYWEASDVTA